MKKLIFILIALLTFSAIADAQLITSSTIRKQRKHELWMDFGAGLNSAREAGDKPQNAFRASVGIRWTKCYSKYFAMDYINFSASYIPKSSEKEGEGGGASLLIGPKAKLPISDKASFFVNANMGVTYLTLITGVDKKNKGYRSNGASYCQETGLGVIFNERVQLTAAYVFAPNLGNYTPKVINDYFMGKFSFSF